MSSFNLFFFTHFLLILNFLTVILFKFLLKTGFWMESLMLNWKCIVAWALRAAQELSSASAHPAPCHQQSGFLGIFMACDILRKTHSMALNFKGFSTPAVQNSWGQCFPAREVWCGLVLISVLIKSSCYTACQLHVLSVFARRLAYRWKAVLFCPGFCGKRISILCAVVTVLIKM